MENTKKDHIHHCQAAGNKEGVEVQVSVKFALSHDKWSRGVGILERAKASDLLPCWQSHLSWQQSEATGQ
jgi:hypothetical protein